ncbi:MAG: hypothetical protein EVA89_14885 [Sandaracinaceae bacterium]|nr:MAG: hypothetical protein EVA89_14885 [Sandaracinaceae bacterium]
MRAHPAILAALALSGCYLSHGRDAPAAARDASVPDAARSDAEPDDAGPPPPPRCALAPTAELFVASHPDGSMSAPDLVRAGDRLALVMFLSDTVRHPVVVMSHADLGLTEVTEPRRVGEESHGWAEAAWTGDALGLCWNADPGGPSALRFREVEGLDGPLGPRRDFAPEDGSCLDLAYADGRYAMIWRRLDFDVDPAQVDTMFAIIDRSGELVGEPVVLARADYPGVSASLLTTEEGFVSLTGLEDGVRVVALRRDGSVLRETTLPIEGAGYTAAALRGDRLALLSLEGPTETRRLVLRVFERGERLLHERVIEDGAPSASYPRVVARPEGFALLWAQGSRPTYRAMILSVDPDGRPLGPRRVLHEGQHSGYGGPSMVSVDGDVDDAVFVAMSRPPPDSPGAREAMHLERWDCAPVEDACEAQDASPVRCDGEERVFGFAWTGESCAPVIGCECVGEDCDALVPTRGACESDREACPAPRCETADDAYVGLCASNDVEAGRATTIWVDALRCDRCAPPTCRVTPSGPGTLALHLEQCGDCVCDGRPETIECALPPLAPGTWTLEGPGAARLTITARPYWERPTPERVCE